jgi:hypothetical protein
MTKSSMAMVNPVAKNFNWFTSSVLLGD